MRSIRPALLPIAILALAGCGGGSSGGSSSGGGSPAAGGGEASKPAAQILADANAALGKVKSFHISGFEVDKDGRSQIEGDVALPGRIHLTLHNKKSVVEMIVVSGVAYMKANSAFWAAQGQARLGTLLGDKWVKVPASATGSLGQFEVLTDPATIGHCMLELHLGTVTKAGTAKVAGKDAVVLAQKADRPGASPGKLYVATSGPVLPLRATQTGKQAPGATPDKTCHETPDDVKSTTSSGDLMLGDYDKAVTIEVPPGALDLERLGGGNLS